MTRAVLKNTNARLDLIETFAYLGNADPRVGDRFFAAVEATLQKIAEFPEMGSLCRVMNPKLNGLRRISVRGFKKHQVFYRNEGATIRVVRVLHGSRDIRSILAAEDDS